MEFLKDLDQTTILGVLAAAGLIFWPNLTSLFKNENKANNAARLYYWEQLYAATRELKNKDLDRELETLPRLFISSRPVGSNEKEES